MPPLFLEKTPSGITSLSLEEVYQKGNSAFLMGEWAKALYYYHWILKEGKGTPYYPYALFQAGLTAFYYGDLPQARTYFLSLIYEKEIPGELKEKAYLNLLDLAERREDWEEAIAFSDLLLPYTESVTREEILTRKTIAQALKEKSLHWEGELYKKIQTLKELQEKGEEIRRDLFPRLYIALGDLYFFSSKNLLLSPDDPALGETMEIKARWLLKSQDQYLRSIWFLDPLYGTKAVFRIGYLYESFYEEVLALPPPKNLSPQEIETYREEVYRLLEPLRKKAIYAYEQLILFSQKYSIDNEWISRAKNHLEKLRLISTYSH
jgi:hypothetical protein